MAQWFPYVLFLHVMGAILAFGPTFAYSIIGAMGGKEPQHANFGLRVTAQIGSRIAYPLAIVQGITGLILMIIGEIPVMDHPWLTAGIVLYLIAVVYALTVQRSALHRIIELSSAPPTPGATGGPPPEFIATVRKVQRGGMMLGALVVVIVFLMVVKPGG